MPYTTLDAITVYERGLADPQSLTSEERLIYLVLELENMADMEGWDHFFVTDTGHYLGELKAGLRAAGDTDSLGVLEDYERQLFEQGVGMEPEALGRFLAAQNDTYFANDRDWREEFNNLVDQRWTRIRQYLSGKYIDLRQGTA